MVKVSKLQAGEYAVSDGRFIVKRGSNWIILKADGGHDFGPVTTLAAAKLYVNGEAPPLGQHNLGSSYGRSKSKKEFNAYLAGEAKRGNYGPIVLWFLVIIGICLFFEALKAN